LDWWSDPIKTIVKDQRAFGNVCIHRLRTASPFTYSIALPSGNKYENGYFTFHHKGLKSLALADSEVRTV